MLFFLDVRFCSERREREREREAVRERRGKSVVRNVGE